VTDCQATVKPKAAEFRPVITRACSCGHGRVQGEPCAGCGNAEPPVTVDLGIQSASYRNPFRQAWWDTVGTRLAARRVRKANAAAR
jgi:hypothetical protein